MPSKVFSAAVVGIDAEKVEVECDAGSGQFFFVIVGLPDTAIQESRERVRAAIKNSGFQFPRGRVTVNLAPADIKKEGPAYDLPIALSILFSETSTHVYQVCMRESLFVGELSLEGEVRAVSGILACAVFAREHGFASIFVPSANAAEAALIDGIAVYPVASLAEVVAHVKKTSLISPFSGTDIRHNLLQCVSDEALDMTHIRGHIHAKRALEIAAAGGHNILMSGLPGSGKTLLARSLPSILPSMTFEEALEVTRMYSVSGLLLPNTSLITRRPFRAPHHTASVASLVGGGSVPRPGEVSLAHRGILFLDEFPEFPRSVLEALRQPLEDGFISVSRVLGSVRYPARCMVVAAQNPCPCGYYGSSTHICICAPHARAKYQKKISGPLLDRIDLFIDVPSVEVSDLRVTSELAENSKTIALRVESARNAQLLRYQSLPIFSNAELASHQCNKLCLCDGAARALLEQAAVRMNLSTRSYYRVLKVARTIADLAARAEIDVSAIAEALQYRFQSYD